MNSLWLLPPKGEPVVVAKTPALVGREAGADLVVAHSSVSRRHALIERSGDEWQVADQKSANGTWIDGQRVIRAVLKAGQSLRFGAVPFEVSFEPPRREAARPAAPAPAAALAPAQPTPIQPVRAPAAPAAPGPSVSAAQAAELLGVAPGASRDQVRRQYQKIYNDYQIRLTNAPTASLKRMYQKSVQELKAAAEALAPGLIGGERE
jgi:DnaJ-domain-containing protein 1